MSPSENKRKEQAQHITNNRKTKPIKTISKYKNKTNKTTKKKKITKQNNERKHKTKQ